MQKMTIGQYAKTNNTIVKVVAYDSSNDTYDIEPVWCGANGIIATISASDLSSFNPEASDNTRWEMFKAVITPMVDLLASSTKSVSYGASWNNILSDINGNVHFNPDDYRDRPDLAPHTQLFNELVKTGDNEYVLMIADDEKYFKYVCARFVGVLVRVHYDQILKSVQNWETLKAFIDAIKFEDEV